MGSDGAKGLLAIRQAGGFTLAQNAATCVVHGIPRVAVREGAVARQGTPAELAALLVEWTA
jgi:two-component system chemotaxis response regulator CheB